MVHSDHHHSSFKHIIKNIKHAIHKAYDIDVTHDVDVNHTSKKINNKDRMNEKISYINQT